MRARISTLATGLAVLLALGACGGDDGDDGAAETTTSTSDGATTTTADAAGTTTAAPPATTAPAPEAPVVEVIDAGAEPRQALRYAFVAGSEHRATVESAQQITAPDGEVALTTSSEVVSRVVAVDGGVASIEIEYGATTVTGGEGTDPATVAQTQAAMDTLTGFVVTQRIDDRGRALETGGDVADVDPALAPFLEQLISSLAQLTIGFPDEPLGQGARWRVGTAVGIGGVATTVDTELTLVGIGAGAVEVESAVRIEQSGLATGTGEGTGRSRIDLAAPLAEGESSVTTTLSSGGVELRQAVTQRITRR